MACVEVLLFEQGNLKEVDERREATDDWLKYCGFADFAASLAQVVPVLFFRRKFVGWWLTMNRTIPFHVALCHHLGQMWIYDYMTVIRIRKRQSRSNSTHKRVCLKTGHIHFNRKTPQKNLGKSWFTSGFPCPTSVTCVTACTRRSHGEVLDGDGDGAIAMVLDSPMWCVSARGSEVQSVQGSTCSTCSMCSMCSMCFMLKVHTFTLFDIFWIIV